MSTFLELRTDAFADNNNTSVASGSPYPAIRRPLRGIEIKDDRYATIMIKQANGMPIPLTDAGSRAGANAGQSTTAAGGVAATKPAPNTASTNIYSNFIIESIEDVRQEKSQIMETFGEPYIFFFGERPRMLNVSGLLFNTLDFNWRKEFWKNYESRLRGTKLVEQNARMYLHWDDIVVEGYPLGAQASETADMPYVVKFAFSLFITNHTYLNDIESTAYPKRAGYYENDWAQQSASDPSFADTLLNGQASAAGVSQLTGIVQGAGQALTATALAAAIAKGGDNTHPLTASSSILKSALSMGLQSSSITFLNVVDEYYRGKRIVNPKRLLPIRSNIYDNADEYVTDGDGGIAGVMAPFDLDYIAYMKEKQEKAKTISQVTGAVQTGLAAVGVDPVKVTANAVLSPFGRGHAITAVPYTPATNISAWGTAISGG